MKAIVILLTAVLPCLLACGASAQGVPGAISYQGKLTDSSGQNVPDGNYSMRFKLFDAQNAGNLLWDSGAMTVATSGGVFTVELQPISSSTLSTSSVWLETTVGPSTLPRVKLASAPFALRAADLSLPFSKSQTSVSELLSVTNTGTGRAARFEVNNTSNLNAAVRVDSNSQASALWCNSTGYGKGMYAASSQAGDAIHGLASGTGVAGRFQVSSATNSSDALLADTSGTGNAGSFSITNLANTTSAVYGTTNGSGPAIEGHTTGTGRAGYFEIDNTSSSTPAVYATTNGTTYSLTAINSTSGNYASLGGGSYGL